MAFIEKRLPVAKQTYFTFFATAGHPTVHPKIDMCDEDDFAPGFPFILDKIRLHLSTSHISVVDFTAWLSHHLSQCFDQNLVSVAMEDVQDVMYQPDPPLVLHDDDIIHFSMRMSAVNVYGLEVSGWAVTE